MSKPKGIAAWLVTWEATSASARVADRVAAMVSSRKSEKTVAQLVEFLYAQVTSDPAELLQYARNPSLNPYRAKIGDTINGVPHGDRIICGGHPWLYARKVKDLRVERNDASGKETISWVEPPTLRWKPDRRSVEEAKPPWPDHVTREISGPLSVEPTWDRAKGSKKAHLQQGGA